MLKTLPGTAAVCSSHLLVGVPEQDKPPSESLAGDTDSLDGDTDILSSRDSRHVPKPCDSGRLRSSHGCHNTKQEKIKNEKKTGQQKRETKTTNAKDTEGGCQWQGLRRYKSQKNQNKDEKRGKNTRKSVAWYNKTRTACQAVVNM